MLYYDDGNLNMLVPWYLMASYLYYEEASHEYSIMTDAQYDKICAQLLSHWDEITHRHKYLIDKDSLSAGTGFTLNYKKFPKIITTTALMLGKNTVER